MKNILFFVLENNKNLFYISHDLSFLLILLSY